MSTLAVPRERSPNATLLTALVAGFLLIPFGLLGPDLLGGLVYLAVDGKYSFAFRQHTGLAVLLTFVAILVLRGAALWLYARWARPRGIFRASFAFDKATALWIGAALVLAVALVALDRTVAPEPRHVSKLTAFIGYWGVSYGVSNTILQFVYYLSEGLAMVWMADAFQSAGEAKVRRWVPWGGIALALFWGGGHVFTKDLATALDLLLPGFVIGSLYSLSRKRVWPAQLLFFLLTLPELFR